MLTHTLNPLHESEAELHFRGANSEKGDRRVVKANGSAFISDQWHPGTYPGSWDLFLY